jgi:hypothetical protein
MYTSILTGPRSLRRYHFFPEPHGRRRKRADSAGGMHPHIQILKKYWLRPVEIVNNWYVLEADQDEDLDAKLDDIEDAKGEKVELVHDQTRRGGRVVTLD